MGRQPLFLFSGGAGYRHEMAAELYRAEPIFRDAVDKCCASPALHDAPDVAASFRGELGDKRLSKPDGLSAIAVLQIAQVELWRAHGVRPGAVLGLSGGELRGAYAAGIFDRDEALRVSRAVSRLSDEPDPHHLFGIPTSSPEAKLIARRAPCNMVFVGSLTPGYSMVIVPVAEEEVGRQYLQDTTVIIRELASKVRYHAPRDPIRLERFTAELGEVTARPPDIPCYLASAGRRPVTHAIDSHSVIWGATRAFYFDEAVEAAVADGWRQVLGIGPTDKLKALVQVSFDAHGAKMDYVASMREDGLDRSAWLSARRAMRWRATMWLPARRSRPRRGGDDSVAGVPVLDTYPAVLDALCSAERFQSAVVWQHDRSVAALDPPHHAPLRGAVRKILSPARADSIEELSETLARDLLKPRIADGEVDVLNMLATPLSEQVLGGLIGLRGAQLQQFADDARGPTGEALHGRVLDALDGLSPVPPLVTELTDELGRDVARRLLRMLWLSGTLTMRRGFADIVLTLGRAPDWRERLLDSPALVGPFVEELLRLHPPEEELRRRAANGGEVLLSLKRANRDPQQFSDPVAIDMQRPPRHLTFGAGPHRCPGAHIARAELRAAVRVILELMPEFELVQPPFALRYHDGVALEELLVKPSPDPALLSSVAK